MPLKAWCPRCPEAMERAVEPPVCPVHGAVPPLWRPEEVSYDGFAEHLREAGEFPTYLPWPMSPGWCVTDFGVVGGGRPGRGRATVTCVSGTSELDGPVDVLVVVEEAGTGLGARCAGLDGGDPGPEVGSGPAAVRVRIARHAVPLWAVSTSGADPEFDRSVFAGEALGCWLWVVLRPASAMLLLRDDWILRDVSGIGAPLLEMPFGGPRPVW